MLKATPRLILRMARITLGVILVVIGIIGGFLPFFQGWIFGVPGLALLAKDIPWLRHRLRPLFARGRLCRMRLKRRRAQRRRSAGR